MFVVNLLCSTRWSAKCELLYFQVKAEVVKIKVD